MTPRFGEPVDLARTYTARPGAYAILPRDNQILLTVQYEDEPDIQLPGGGIDPGELTLPALHREILEETGWKVGRPRRIGVFRRFVFMPEYDLWAEKICSVYLARPAFRLCDPLEETHSELWLPIWDAIDVLDNPGDSHFLELYLKGLA